MSALTVPPNGSATLAAEADTPGEVGASGLREASGLHATTVSAAASKHTRQSETARCGDMEILLGQGWAAGRRPLTLVVRKVGTLCITPAHAGPRAHCRGARAEVSSGNHARRR